MTGGALVLIGPMGAGKSSIGRKVAKALGLSFTDTDTEIVRANGPIPAIFAEHGEPRFRALERAAVEAALAGGGVVALGGGAVMNPDTQADLAAHRVVRLDVSPRVVAGRIGVGSSRPMLGGGPDPMEQWKRIREERRPIYTAVADVTFDTSRGRISDVVDAIVAWAKQEEER